MTPAPSRYDFSALFPNNEQKGIIGHAKKQHAFEQEKYNGASIADMSFITDISFTTLYGSDKTTKQERTKQDSMTWIDGGSAILLESPVRVIGVVRTCALRTRGLVRENIHLTTSMVSITRQHNTEQGVTYHIRQKPLQGDALLIPEELQVHDLVITDKKTDKKTDKNETSALIDIASLIDVIRSVAERQLANAMRTMYPQDTIVIDGSVRTLCPIVQRCTLPYNTIAIAKTSAEVTSNGRPLTQAMSERAREQHITAPWCTAINTTQQVHLYCAQLCSRASRAFLIETATIGALQENTLALLSAWSADLAFSGYPYPLVLCDQLARVTNSERDMWRAMLASDAPWLRDELAASDTHDVLEHILYGKRSF